MAKGSQLSQLKSALSQAGVTGNQQNGKKRKRTNSQEKDKDKRAAKLDEIHKKLNPFDTKVTKLKHDVGGRKVKGVTGKPSQSKQTGLEQRKRTLLVEYEEKGRAGGIVDRRFGENDPTMSVEERMLERFTKERQRSSRGAAFNLEDEDELTHYGQSLSKLDDFDNVGLGVEDEEERGQLDPDIVGKTHFGGFSDDEDEDDGQPERKKSKAEVMAEVMAKSKEHRLRRQMEREEEDNVRHELDQEFDSLRDLIYAPDPSASGSNSIPLGSAPKPIEVDAPDGDYDQRVRELAFEARAKPKDRTKTEEELALAEKEALEKAERRRRKRMLGLEDSDSEGEEGRSRKKRKRGGDDLEDDFEDEEEGWNGIGMGLGAQAPAVAGDDADASAGDEEASEGEEDDDEAGDEDDEESEGQLDDEEESEVDGDHEELIASAKPSRKSKAKAPDKELPFTFPCPTSHDEFFEIVNDIEDKDVPTVVQRIRALYHTSLAPENKVKLQVLTSVLIDHLLYISSPPEPRFDLVSSLLPHIFALTRAYPVQAAENFVAKLSLMHKNLRRGLSRGALDPQSKTWPGLSELVLLRIIGSTWPTSDLNHAVVSPTRVLMGAYLGLGRVRSLADIASGLFLCTLFLQFEGLSKRLVPEAVNFAVNSVLHLAPSGYADISALPGVFPAPDFRSELYSGLALDFKKAKKAVPKADLVALLTTEVPTEAGKAQLLGLAVDLLGRFADMYKGLEGFIELFEPVLDILLHVREQNATGSLETRITSASDVIRRLLKFAREARQPLVLQAHKPIPIPTYIPKFETSKSSYMRRQDPDHERNEAAKLRSQYKQERKGAIRELRKDSRFLAGVEQKKQAEKDKSYNESLKKVYGSIQTERAEEKAMEREKSREKKRSGRK
ncbi:nucleolar protein 14 [Mycena polygramma]|nr:nucleolar protein 14 [Mycena polygramma]